MTPRLRLCLQRLLRLLLRPRPRLRASPPHLLPRCLEQVHRLPLRPTFIAD